MRPHFSAVDGKMITKGWILSFPDFEGRHLGDFELSLRPSQELLTKRANFALSLRTI